VDLHSIANTNGIVCLDTDDINSPETVAWMADLAPDYLYTLGWSQIFGAAVLDVPSRFVVGSHPSPLPEGRGRAPIPWMVIEGIERGAVSLFRMARGADAGPMLVQRSFDVPPRADAGQLYERASATLRDAYCELHAAILAGAVRETAQDERRASYRGKRVASDGHLDFSKARQDVDRLIRAVTRPYPGAYAYHRGVRVQVWRSDLDDIPAFSGTVGQILLQQQGRLLVQAGDGALWLTEITIDGQVAVLRDLPVGSRFGYRVEDVLHALREEVAML
jgi:methionyl-tRNA formyltransferase